MSDQSFLILFALIIVVSSIVAIYQTLKFEKRIEQTIISKGFKLVSVSRRWFDFDEGTASFDVVYQDNAGFTHETKCKIRSYLYIFDGDLYWSSPLVEHSEEELARRKFEERRTSLIDNLRAENAMLKKRVKELEELVGSKKGF